MTLSASPKNIDVDVSRRRTALGLLFSAGLTGCAGLGTGDDEGARPVTARGDPFGALLKVPGSSMWNHLDWPGKKNVRFSPAQYQGRDALQVNVDRSMSVLRRTVSIEGGPTVRAGLLTFSWAVGGMLGRADLGVSGQDDAPLRVVLAFGGDRSRLSSRTRMQSELSRAVLGEELPFATLVYVWCNTRPVGTVLVSPRTDRVRKIVVESGAAHVGQWRTYERSVTDDYRLAYGEAPGPLTAVALMSDADNTGERVTAWYGALHLRQG